MWIQFNYFSFPSKTNTYNTTKTDIFQNVNGRFYWNESYTNFRKIPFSILQTDLALDHSSKAIKSKKRHHTCLPFLCSPSKSSRAAGRSSCRPRCHLLDRSWREKTNNAPKRTVMPDCVLTFSPRPSTSRGRARAAHTHVLGMRLALSPPLYFLSIFITV